LILLVDDDPALLGALSFAFETDGFSVAAYMDAESALARAPTTPVSCLVLDLNLPGMSGLALLEGLRAGGETAPAVLITTNPPATIRAKAQAAGAEIVEKPLLGDTLRRKVGDLVRR
jgi:DNA-binding response OmpR family regulator